MAMTKREFLVASGAIPAAGILGAQSVLSQEVTAARMTWDKPDSVEWLGAVFYKAEWLEQTEWL